MDGLKTLKQVRVLFGDFNPHLEVQRARRNEDARDYCLKDETRVAGPWEFGEFCPSGSNRRKIREMVRNSPERMEEEAHQKECPIHQFQVVYSNLFDQLFILKVG